MCARDEEVEDHPLLTLLNSVKGHMTGPELKYVLMAHLELTGNAFWFLEGAASEAIPARAIHPLNPGRMQVKLNKAGFPFGGPDNYIYYLCELNILTNTTV